MKIYLAASYTRADEMRGVRDVLAAVGNEITARWIDHAQYDSSLGAEVLNVQPTLGVVGPATTTRT